jgi:hypothetical protein
MKEGVYRVAIVVTEVRTAIPLETGLRFVDLASNSTLRKTAVIASSAETRTSLSWTKDGKAMNQTVAWTRDSVTSTTEMVRSSPVPWDHVTAPKQPLWSWNGTSLMAGKNDTHV